MREKWTYVLLFLSGFSALTYQVVWMREFRLVFGASTGSTAAVSALFMAGLGIGSRLMGPRVDRIRRPLLFYARIELAISLLAALSPWLLLATRSLYLQSGGMMVLGFWGATVARLGLAAIVVGVPAVLMGGTLPAAVRAVTSTADSSRASLGLLYGINTIGALTGTVFANFILLEKLGARRTLFIAVGVNLLLSLWAMRIGKTLEVEEEQKTDTSPEAQTEETQSADKPGLPILLAQIIAFGAGFAFFLMELVWYRMLAPILGGSTYTFGLVLAVALAGIGLGGALYPVVTRRRGASVWLLTATCLLEALALMFPYALGDRIAMLTAQLQSLTVFGFWGAMIQWTIIALIVVFPASLISGVQFPLLIALIGHGRKQVGSHTGKVYACNTAGSIVGSLAGGFGLIPYLSAQGCWVASGVVMVFLGLLSAMGVLFRRRTPENPPANRSRFGVLCTLLAIILVGMCFLATGPTAAWRHAPIGAKRIQIANTYNEMRGWMERFRTLLWQTDGVESAVAIDGMDGYSFIVNGKGDGSVIGDKGTQIMCGVLAATMHPEPKRAMVVGLGTGCTAGWLSAIEGMEQVDVIELEPAVLVMAEACAAANHDIIEKERLGKGVRIIINDAREVLNTVPEEYDLIVSEPSNPYRAGIASLFTLEFYQEVHKRLAPKGIFVNWCQAYEINTETVFSILGTLKQVFPYVECWYTQRGDLVFISSAEPIMPDAAAIRERLLQPTYRDAMRFAWYSNELEMFLAHFIASNDFIQIAVRNAPINTDDRTHVEYDYARTVGRKTSFSIGSLADASFKYDVELPPWAPEDIDKEKLALYRAFSGLGVGISYGDSQERIRAVTAWTNTLGLDLPQIWMDVDNISAIEALAAAEILAEKGDEKALEYLEKIRDLWPSTTSFVRARLAWKNQDIEKTTQEIEAACIALRSSPWEPLEAVFRGINLIEDFGGQNPDYAQRLFKAIEHPFALRVLDSRRSFALLKISVLVDTKLTEHVLRTEYEPNVIWSQKFLLGRLDCYNETNNPLLPTAIRQFQDYVEADSMTVDTYIKTYVVPEDMPAQQ